MKKGTLVLSLDFELIWGVFDHVNIQDKATYFDSTLKVIPRLLDLFEKQNIQVTWATVGMLFNTNWEEWFSNFPKVLPSYQDQDLNPYRYGEMHRKNGLDRFFFAPKLIKDIQSVHGQEVGTHTYSHYYCLEQGQTKEQFDADITQAIKVAAAFSITLDSLVFPRNQFNELYVEVCENHHIKTVRTNPSSWYWNVNKPDTLLTKMARTGDAYFPIGKKSYNPNAIQKATIVEQPASRFFRPQNAISILNSTRVLRIKNEIIAAAQKGEVYHLWWHPHNFGVDSEGALNALRQILSVYKYCADTYGMESKTMREFASPYLIEKPNHAFDSKDKK